MSPIVKCLAMALALLAVGGCAYRDAVVLESGEKVNNIEAKPVDVTTPAFRDINIQNINCRNTHRAMFFNGLPEMPIERISLRNIYISADQDAEFFNCKGITKENVNITIQK